MGQATSKNLRPDAFYDYKDVGNKFTKVTLSTLAVPMVIIAFPLLNAYTFTEEELTGFKVMDGAIGGLLGVIGWPLAPFLACYGVFQVMFKEGPTEPLPIPKHIKDAARRSIGLNCEQFYNVAVVGVSGTGKSSVVNGILGYRDHDKDAAATGESETTKKPRAYRHPDLRSMVLWDMPGANTMNHPGGTYFEDKFLCAFDSLIIVTAERLMETDIQIAKQAQLCQIPILIVRNKADQAIGAKIRKLQHAYEDEQVNRSASQPRTATTILPSAIHPKNSNNKGDGDMDKDKIWAQACGQLGKEVRKSIYRQMKDNKLSTKRLFTISAWNLQEFVHVLSHKQLDSNLKLIDEQRFLRVLIEGVILKRKRELTKTTGTQ
ncbi:interferon-inducible GTPase-domain-containing protein [Absidia repens]|uniref:Interferon-inducible GTPase-domain-containing protein n=1 Tax=Absidia repens TaxID=90262 RepID=A0A1X2I0L8_9FUNG|nr:interferon-inducible GTPase-domain-containing protein [Absidia repens]